MPGEDPSAGSLESFIANDGLRLTYRMWRAPQSRATVRVIHGLGEHGGRYIRLAHQLQKERISVCAVDLRGHGSSQGERGHVARFSDFLQDVDAFTRETADDQPTILFGHSLGGLIALRAVQTDHAGQPVGLILSAPGLALAAGTGGWKAAAADALVRIAPKTPFANGIDATDLTHDPVEIAAYRNDPLVHDRITPRLFVEMRTAMKAVSADAASVDLPVLLLAPGKDPVADVAVALEVASRFSGAVTVRSYPDSLHEPLSEIDRDRALEGILQWVRDTLE